MSCVYRPPNYNLKNFNENFFTYVEELTKANSDVYICGDFNIDMLKYDTHSESRYFIDSMFSMGFIPKITKPTRVTADSTSLIDNIWCNKIADIEKTLSGIVVEDISDHLPVFYIQNIETQK